MKYYIQSNEGLQYLLIQSEDVAKRLLDYGIHNVIHQSHYILIGLQQRMRYILQFKNIIQYSL